MKKMGGVKGKKETPKKPLESKEMSKGMKTKMSNAAEKVFFKSNTSK